MNAPRRQVFRGDIGSFRRALVAAGFTKRADTQIFNDDSKAKPKQPTRRLKLWFASSVFNAPQAQQRKLERALRKEFGDRIISMYFVRGCYSWSKLNDSKSLCIKLKDIK